MEKAAHMMIMIMIMDIKVPFVLFPVIELHARIVVENVGEFLVWNLGALCL